MSSYPEAWARNPPAPGDRDYAAYVKAQPTERARLRRLAESVVGPEHAELLVPAAAAAPGFEVDTRSVEEQVAAFRPAEMLSTTLPGVPDGMKPALAFRTARELMAMVGTTVPWLVRLLAAFGAITELDGAPKRAGKTTFLAYMIAAVLDGRPFLGQPTTKTPIVLLSEQPSASLRAVLARAGLADRDDLHLLLWRDAVGASWPAIVAAAVERCREFGAALVVDTLPQFAGLRGDSENDAGAALEAVRPLQAAAADGLCIIVSRHDRKGGGETGESARGSSAFTGAVDIVLRLARKPDAARPTIRELSALSRFDEAPADVLIELTETGYIAVSEQALAREVARAAVLDHLPERGGLTRDELVERTGLGRTAVGMTLTELLAEGLIRRIGAGVKGDPYRFTAGPDAPVPGTSNDPGQTGPFVPDSFPSPLIGRQDGKGIRPSSPSTAIEDYPAWDLADPRRAVDGMTGEQPYQGIGSPVRDGPQPTPPSAAVTGALICPTCGKTMITIAGSPPVCTNGPGHRKPGNGAATPADGAGTPDLWDAEHATDDDAEGDAGVD